MFNILILLAISAIVGYLLRNIKQLRPVINKSTTITVLALLFVFGMNIGSNKDIISNLHHDGLKAAVIALFGVAGSVGAASLYSSFLNKRKGGQK